MFIVELFVFVDNGVMDCKYVGKNLVNVNCMGENVLLLLYWFNVLVGINSFVLIVIDL